MNNSIKATPKQTWAIFCLSKVDVRDCNLTLFQASAYIDLLKSGDAEIISTIAALPGAVVKGVATPKHDWQAVYREACDAGQIAGDIHAPTPMIVSQHSNPLNDSSPVQKQWYVEGGVCGFASVVVTPGNCSFAKWLAKSKIGHKHYYGGWEIWIDGFGQSMERKEACASKMVEVLSKYGIKSRVWSRMD